MVCSLISLELLRQDQLNLFYLHQTLTKGVIQNLCTLVMYSYVASVRKENQQDAHIFHQ
jgi:hypothetical protein